MPVNRRDQTNAGPPSHEPYRTLGLLIARDPAFERVCIAYQSFHLHVSSERYRFPRHQHPDHELIFADRGVYQCRLNADTVTLRPGQVLIVAPRDWHEDFYRPPLRFYVAHLTMSRLFEGREQILSMVHDGVRGSDRVAALHRPSFWPLLRRLAEENLTGDAFSRPIQDGILRELFWRLVRAMPRGIVSPLLLDEPSHAGLARRLLALFESNMHRPLRVSEMARQLAMSESSLAHQCRAELSCTPAAAFARYRVERAVDLLRSTSMSVKQVGAYLGFSNPYHFSRVFRRASGFPPVTLTRERAMSAR